MGFNNSICLVSWVHYNVRREYLDYNGFPLIVLVTNEPIKAGEIVGFNYGYGYWTSRECVPEFFDKKGDPISHQLYKRVFGCLQFDRFSYTGDFKPLVEAVKQRKATVVLTDDSKREQRITIGELAGALIKAGALTVSSSLLEQGQGVQPIVDLPQKVAIVDKNKSVVVSFAIGTLQKQRDFYELRALVGKEAIAKSPAERTYEISKEWLMQVAGSNPSAISQLAEMLGTTEVEFRSQAGFNPV